MLCTTNNDHKTYTQIEMTHNLKEPRYLGETSKGQEGVCEHRYHGTTPKISLEDKAHCLE